MRQYIVLTLILAALLCVVVGCDSESRNVVGPVTVNLDVAPAPATSAPAVPNSGVQLPGLEVPVAVDIDVDVDGSTVLPTDETPLIGPARDTGVPFNAQECDRGRGDGNGSPGNGKGRGDERGCGA